MISKQEQTIANYKEDWQAVDMAMYIAGVLQQEDPYYCKEIENRYWQDIQAEKQEQQTDMEITM